MHTAGVKGIGHTSPHDEYCAWCGEDCKANEFCCTECEAAMKDAIKNYRKGDIVIFKDFGDAEFRLNGGVVWNGIDYILCGTKIDDDEVGFCDFPTNVELISRVETTSFFGKIFSFFAGGSK